MRLQYQPRGPIILVGGAGVVGRTVAPLLAASELHHEIVVAGRDAARAQPVIDSVRRLGGAAHFERLVVGESDARAPARPAALVVGLVNDPADALLDAALAGAVPFVDVTRWTARLATGVGRVAAVRPSSPVVFSSGWMGGLLPRAAAHLVEVVGRGAAVQGAVRYALADASGPDSVEYMDRMWIPFEVSEAGRPVVVEPFRDRRRVSVDGHRTTVARFDTPEQWTLPFTLGVQSAAVRIGFDNGIVGALLFGLVRAGVFWLLRGERFRALRQALLRSSGAEQRPGASAAFRVDVHGEHGARALTVRSAAGQAALTAIGALLSVRWALTMPERGGAFFPEQDPANALLPELLVAAGAGVDLSPT